MKANALRGFLAVALLVSLGIRYHSIHEREAILAKVKLPAVIASVVASHGMVLRANPVQPPKVLSRIVYFERPGCDAPSLAMPTELHIDAMGYLARTRISDYRYSFIYIDKTWKSQDRIGLHFNWLKHTALGVIGKSAYFPLQEAIVLAEPAKCATTDTIDWKQVWDKARLAAMVADARARPARMSASVE